MRAMIARFGEFLPLAATCAGMSAGAARGSPRATGAGQKMTVVYYYTSVIKDGDAIGTEGGDADSDPGRCGETVS